MSQLARQVEEIRERVEGLPELEQRLAAVVDGTAQRRCRHGICHPDGPCHCPTFERSLAVPDNWTPAPFASYAALVMRHVTERVDAEFWQVGPTTLTIACTCRRALRVPRGQQRTDCKCGRVYVWTGRRLCAVTPENVQPTPKEGL